MYFSVNCVLSQRSLNNRLPQFSGLSANNLPSHVSFMSLYLYDKTEHTKRMNNWYMYLYHEIFKSVFELH